MNMSTTSGEQRRTLLYAAKERLEEAHGYPDY